MDGTCSDCACIGGTACDDCLLDAQLEGGACYDEVIACNDNPECYGLIDCANACMDQACVDQCVADFPGGVDDLLALQDCIFGPDGTSGACGAVCG
jgi:hypothetical protein